jgi:hypothetical protein
MPNKNMKMRKLEKIKQSMKNLDDKLVNATIEQLKKEPDYDPGEYLGKLQEKQEDAHDDMIISVLKEIEAKNELSESQNN